MSRQEEPLEFFMKMLEQYVRPTNLAIFNHFENFGPSTWGPIFNECAFREAMKTVRPLVESSRSLFDEIDLNVDTLIKTFNIYTMVYLVLIKNPI